MAGKRSYHAAVCRRAPVSAAAPERPARGRGRRHRRAALDTAGCLRGAAVLGLNKKKVLVNLHSRYI